MCVTVLLAEDAEVMRLAIRRVLDVEPGIELLGEAVTLSQTLQMTAELMPNVVLMDLHMPGERELSPRFIKSQLFLSTKHVLMMSVWNDEESKALANSYGAFTLLDKSDLQSSLVPTIMQFS